jgi:protein-S-isoprenylcysteine O-methyltransferase Ste14
MDQFISPLLIIGSFAVYSVLHSFLASRPVKAWAEKRFGESVVSRTYRLFFNLVGVVTLFPVYALVVLLPDRPLYTIPSSLQPIFVIGQGIGIVILAAALGLTGALDFAGVQQLAGRQQKPHLVTEGIYRYIRHPLYTGSMLVLWLMPSMSLNWFAFTLGISLYFVIGARYEERKLEAFFGRQYTEYKAKTPAFIPQLRNKL